MSRRSIILLVLAILAAAAIAAVAAVGSAPSIPLARVTPQVHQLPGEGYFRVVVPQDGGTAISPAALSARVISGDAFLVTILGASASDARHGDGADDAVPGDAQAGITITGRFAKPGPVRIRILARNASAAFKPLMEVAFTIPPGVTGNQAVRQEWARMQQAGLASADPEGNDSFSQYWNLAIAPRYGLSPRLHEAPDRSRREPPDLYSVFTGAAAIQETLQLELLGSGIQSGAQQESIRRGGTPPVDQVPLAGLSGPAVRSHPFKEMLAGRNPRLPALASLIPDDQYAVFFASINSQIELADLMDEWGGNLLHQAQASARDFEVRGKISRQLCLEDSWLTRMFGDRVIADMAFTGRDPFLKEGTAVTVLFSLKDQGRFRRQMERRYAEAVRQSGAQRSVFSMHGMSGFSAVSPDTRVSSHTLIIGDTAAVSTSKTALERIVAARAGRLPTLAQADDFRYMRTIFPQNAAEEDIFIYLSDAHIRNLVGPRWKIGEARRMRCSGGMTLLANARLWFKAEQRREPTLEELAKGGYLGSAVPACPDHGVYDFDSSGQPRCSLHNRQGLLTAVDELPLAQVTGREAAQYKAFVENYNRYWTRFFDPIGIRVKMGKDIRIQTCILPLIENSWYDGFAGFSGRSPGELSESSLLPRTIMSLRGHMAPQVLNETSLARDLKRRSGINPDWLGDEISLNLCDGPVLFSAGGRAAGLVGQGVGRSSLEPLVIGYLGSALNLPTYLSVKVTDPQKAEQGIPALFRALAPRRGSSDVFSVETYSIEEHSGKPVYVAAFNIWLLKLRLYSAVVDDRLVIASRRDIVTDLLDASGKGAAARVARNEGNMELSVYRTAFKQLEETVNLGWQEDLRHACHRNLPLSAILLTSLGLAPETLDSTVAGLRGYRHYCPSGGQYAVDEQSGAVICTVHGSARDPKQQAAGDTTSRTLRLVNALERVNARMTFTPEGLMTTVDIKRTSK